MPRRASVARELAGEPIELPIAVTYTIANNKIADVRVHPGDQHALDRFVRARPLRPVTDREGNGWCAMNTEEIVKKYYELANKGDWDAWSDLFAMDTVMDEQLAGHIEGRETLRDMMKGFPEMYASFQNVPQHYVIGTDGETAAVVTHISRRDARGQDHRGPGVQLLPRRRRPDHLHGQLPRHRAVRGS